MPVAEAPLDPGAGRSPTLHTAGPAGGRRLPQHVLPWAAPRTCGGQLSAWRPRVCPPRGRRTGPGEPCDGVSVCFASRPRCRCPLTVAVVTVTPAPPIVLLTYRCRLSVLESRSLRLLCLYVSLPGVAVSFLSLVASFPEPPSCRPCLLQLCVPCPPSVWGALWSCRASSLALPEDPRLGVPKPLLPSCPSFGLGARAQVGEAP